MRANKKMKLPATVVVSLQRVTSYSHSVLMNILAVDGGDEFPYLLPPLPRPRLLAQPQLGISLYSKRSSSNYIEEKEEGRRGDTLYRNILLCI